MNREPDFDPVARPYRWVEYLALGRTLKRTREHFLPRLSACKQALALGDGDGRFLARLLRRNPQMHAVAIDSSSAMLTLLRKRCGERVHTIHGSAREVVPPPGTDLVITHFFLDCFFQTQVEEMVRAVASDLAPETLWVLSEFGVPRVPWLRPFAALYVRALYLAFRVLTGLRVTRLPRPQQALRSAGFALVARQEFLLGLLYTELWKRT